ncbi:UTP--glucose-1-phosphate uridylyltransferase, partial [Weissella cibaria]|nr:UTP--glucose-1-phosphate uridylyltransferase [Weissella cibaria]
EVSKYGVIDPSEEVEKDLYNVSKFVEKPAVDEAPSNLAIIGRYVLTPEIFNILEKQGLGEGNEVQLTDAIDTLNKKQRVFAKVFNGDRYDVGNKFGFLKTNIEYGLKHPETKDELKTYIKELAKELEEK